MLCISNLDNIIKTLPAPIEPYKINYILKNYNCRFL